MSVIQLKDISKSYRIYANPRDRLKQLVFEQFYKLGSKQKNKPLYNEEWVLKEINIEIAAGESVGIFGRNGAGKSTLLQIIAGILRPTTGSVVTNGRITALLELGSSFNAEFTGRENIIYNMQIFGVSGEEAESKYEEIVSFADIGNYIDQPIKTYSSGMSLRLAFSVQTALQPQILIVDEALSVGDIFFQAKCMAKIKKMIDDGTTLLFVSHDISVIRQICNKGIFINNGRIKEMGNILSTTDSYLSLSRKPSNFTITQNKQVENPGIDTSSINDSCIISSIENEEFELNAKFSRISNGDARVVNLQTFKSEITCKNFEFNDRITVRLTVKFYKEISSLFIGIKVRTLQGIGVLQFDTRLQKIESINYNPGDIYVYDWEFNLPIVHGKYIIACTLAHPPENHDGEWRFIDDIPYACELSVSPREEGAIDAFVSIPAMVYINKY